MAHPALGALTTSRGQGTVPWATCRLPSVRFRGRRSLPPLPLKQKAREGPFLPEEKDLTKLQRVSLWAVPTSVLGQLCCPACVPDSEVSTYNPLECAFLWKWTPGFLPGTLNG